MPFAIGIVIEGIMLEHPILDASAVQLLTGREQHSIATPGVFRGEVLDGVTTRVAADDPGLREPEWYGARCS